MSTPVRLCLTGALAFCFLVLLSVTPGHADGPLIEESTFVVDNEPMANCGDFLIIADGSGKNRLRTYFDTDGNPIRVVFQGRYRGTMTNSVTGASIDDAPSVANITFDLIAGTQTNTGAFFTATLPGRGAVLIEAGRLVFDGFGPPVFIAGPHRPSEETIDILCDALR